MSSVNLTAADFERTVAADAKTRLNTALANLTQEP